MMSSIFFALDPALIFFSLEIAAMESLKIS